MQKIIDNPKKLQKFLYNTLIGRFFLKFFTLRFISKLAGLFMSSFFSKFLIKSFVKKNNINLEKCEKKQFKNYNDFFTRKYKKESLNIDSNSHSFIAPCDSKLQIFKIDENSTFSIKNSLYDIKSILNNNPVYKEYLNGYFCIFRLSVDDYHRYIYLDNGQKNQNIYIKGKLHTVHPIALNNYNIYKQNSREYTVLQTENFGDIIQIEVGALMVGKINNFHEQYNFKKGEEKGMFLFGGSTICLMAKQGYINFNQEILNNTCDGFETKVQLGQKIGSKV